MLFVSNSPGFVPPFLFFFLNVFAIFIFCSIIIIIIPVVSNHFGVIGNTRYLSRARRNVIQTEIGRDAMSTKRYIIIILKVLFNIVFFFVNYFFRLQSDAFFSFISFSPPEQPFLIRRHEIISRVPHSKWLLH